MAGTDTKTAHSKTAQGKTAHGNDADGRTGTTGTGDPTAQGDLAGLEAGLDALETRVSARVPLWRILLSKASPPLLAITLVITVWQLVAVSGVKPDYMLPGPADVWASITDMWYKGTLLGVVWNSVSRGALGFAASVVIGTALGLLVARIKVVRAAIGPILSGLQSLPSVAWVPPAVIWLGLNDSMMFAVILLGAVPSIANGLVAGIDQIPPLFLRAGRTLGATGLRGARYIVMPAALPGYVAGLKQGWAFSWRSLMAAEIIASSPDLGVGLGQLLENGRNNSSMPQVFLAILLILCVGIAIDLLIFSPLERRVLRGRGLLVSR